MINERDALRRYFLTLAYKGTHFLGWQKQPDGRTVQGVLEGALSTIMRREVAVVGAGRTDTGVHASHYVCHLDLPLDPDGATELIFRANRLLPRDLRLYEIREVSPYAHARFDALSRRYGYHVTSRPSPFDEETVTVVPYSPMDYDAMNVAARALLGTHDFTTFSKGKSDVKTHICTVTEAEWTREGSYSWVFHYTANRFLRNMVRATVGTLFDVGRGKMTVSDFVRRKEACDRSLASGSAPAEGLFLEGITYPPTVEITPSGHKDT